MSSIFGAKSFARILGSVRGWHVYTALAVVLVFFSWLAWASYQRIDQELTRLEVSRHYSHAELAAAILDEKFNRLTGIGVALATRVQFRELIEAGQWQQAVQILSMIPDDFPNIRRVFLTDPEGTETADLPALEGGVGKNFAFRDWYQGVSRDWQPYISHVYQRTATPQRIVFSVAVPIKRDNGEILGILVMQIDLEGFFHWTEELELNSSRGHVYVVDSDGGLAYHAGLPTQARIRDYSHVPAVQHVMQGNSDVEISVNPLSNEQELSAYVPVSHGWGVVVHQPVATAFTYRDRQLNTVLLGYSLFLALVLLIARLFSRMIQQHMKVHEDERLRRELEDQWAFFRRVMDIDRNMIFVKDDQGRFVLVNEAVADVFGTTKEEMIGKTDSDYIPEKALVDKFRRDEQEVIQSQTEKIIPEIMIRDVRGDVRWLQVVMQPLTSVDGKTPMVLGVSCDITERIQMESELRHNVERFETIARATNDAVWDWNFEAGSLWWNESFKTLFGYSNDDGIEKIEFWEERMHPADRQRIMSSIQTAIDEGKEHWEGEYRFLRKDGSYAYVHDHGYIVRNNRGEAYRMLGSITDITERYEQEAKIERLSRIRNILSETNYAIVRIRDRERLLQEACRICVEHGGFELAWVGLLDSDSKMVRPVAAYGNARGYLEAVKFSIDENSHEGQSLTGSAIRNNKVCVSNDIETDDNVVYRDQLLERGFRSMVALPMVIGDRAIGSLSLYSEETHIFDTEEIGLLKELVSDVAFALEYLEKDDKVRFLAYYDALTGLSNRDLFLDRLTQYLNTADSDDTAGILMLDIERFSSINEVYGHEIGDQLLKVFSRHIQQSISDSDHIARLASNTFAILLTKPDSASDVANFIENNLLPCISMPIQIDDIEHKISVRIGVAMMPTDGSDAEILIKNAEAALKSAKQSGDKYLFYARQMNAQVAEKLELENRLHTALEKEQFVLHYQPKINLASNSICGLEALIRWKTDEGLIPPDKFIPLLEETGWILDVGQWVIKQAMQDYQDWTARGLNPPPIAVNISAIQLKQKNFVERIDDIVLRNANEAPWLELEITETIIMDQMEENIAKLKALRERNIGVSIDDFGTGYSSLRYMSKLPVSALKIDRSFIANLIRNVDDTAIVTAVIPLAHSLKLKVIAEGVETEEQLNLLHQFQCDEYQGYLFSPPLSAADLERLLQENQHSN